MALDRRGRVTAEGAGVEGETTMRQRGAGPGTRAHYQYRVFTLAETTSRNDARRLLTDAAEYGRWELARSMVFPGGRRKVWLRRRIIRVESTL